MTPLEVVTANLARVRERIDAAGGEGVRLIAVTKGRDADWARAAVAAGVDDLGENYAGELVAKAAELGEEGPRWHFIGQLQTNKVRVVAPLASTIQSVDRPSLVRELAKRAPGATILVQVDLTGRPDRGGCAPGAVDDLVGVARDAGLDVVGLMAVAPPPDEAPAGPAFASVARLRDRLGLPELSIGMSGDLEAAVEVGATMVRVGRALFATIDPFRPPGSG